jgi:hypothetical protein
MDMVVTVGGAGAWAQRAVARFAKPVKISVALTELVEADAAAFWLLVLLFTVEMVRWQFFKYGMFLSFKL